MNAPLAVEASGVGKLYRLGELHRQRGSFRDMVADRVSRLFGARRESEPKGAGTIWALRNLSFSVPEGQVTGVVGRNGAGKSTLLKVLSRITPPTTGRIEIRGRVASLLEVGAGFHPELTGRENIYLNGSILGLRRAEITSRLKQISEFAEIEQFLDTPVKRYSSGMYVRLAFSVAAHIEPDVLLVDEVLSVGDAEFQRRCIGRMGDIARSGRTVVFVSHNIGLVQQLCTHSMYLVSGALKAYGPSVEVLPMYLRDGVERQGKWQAADEEGILARVSLADSDGNPTSVVTYVRGANVVIDFRSGRKDADYVLAVRVTDGLGHDLLTSWDTDSVQRSTVPGRSYRAVCRIPGELLRPGRYSVMVMARLSRHGYLEKIEEAELELEVSEIGCRIPEGRFGLIAPVLEWSCSEP